VAVVRPDVLHARGEGGTEGNGQDLQAAAYPEQRNTVCLGRPDEGDLGVVAGAIDIGGARGVATGQKRVEIAAAGKEQGVDDVQETHRLGPGQHHRPGSGSDQTVEVPGRAAGHGQRAERLRHDVLVSDHPHHGSAVHD